MGWWSPLTSMAFRVEATNWRKCCLFVLHSLTPGQAGKVRGKKILRSWAKFMEGIWRYHWTWGSFRWFMASKSEAWLVHPKGWTCLGCVPEFVEQWGYITMIWQLKTVVVFYMRFMILRLPFLRANFWNQDERGRVRWLKEWWSWLNGELPPWILTTENIKWQEPTWTEVEFWSVLNLNF